MPGAILIVIVMVLVGPPLVMFTGAIWSALLGWFLGHEAQERAEGQPT